MRMMRDTSSTQRDRSSKAKRLRCACFRVLIGLEVALKTYFSMPFDSLLLLSQALRHAADAEVVAGALREERDLEDLELAEVQPRVGAPNGFLAHNDPFYHLYIDPGGGRAAGTCSSLPR